MTRLFTTLTTLYTLLLLLCTTSITLAAPLPLAVVKQLVARSPVNGGGSSGGQGGSKGTGMWKRAECWYVGTFFKV